MRATTYNYNSTRLNYNFTTPHYIQQLWWCDHCNHCNQSKKQNITKLQPPVGPSVSYFWNFRRRLVRHYWYDRQYKIGMISGELFYSSPGVQAAQEAAHLFLVLKWSNHPLFLKGTALNNEMGGKVGVSYPEIQRKSGGFDGKHESKHRKFHEFSP